jgi:hypothetical protein
MTFVSQIKPTGGFLKQLQDLDGTTWERVVKLLGRGGAKQYYVHFEDYHINGSVRSRCVSTWFPAGHPAPFPRDDDLYMGVNPAVDGNHSKYSRTTKPSKHGIPIASVNALYADLDRDKRSTEEPHLPFAPNVLVETSPSNYYGLWILDEPLIIKSQEDYSRAEALQNAMVSHASGDLGANDLHRILRVAGTHNTKYQETPIVRIVSSNLGEGALYDIQWLEEKLSAWRYVKKEPSFSPSDIDFNLDDDQKEAGAKKCLLGCLNQVASGARRNKTGFILASKLRNGRLTKDQALHYMRAYWLGVDEHIHRDHPYRWDEAFGSLNSAWSYSVGSIPREFWPEVDEEMIIEEFEKLTS